MGKKIGNNNPPPSFESVARAFQGVLDAPEKEGGYFVAERTKDKCEIDGVVRGDITYLSQKSKKHGPAAAVYRLSGQREAHYKEARIYLRDLVSRAQGEWQHLNHDQRWAVQNIDALLSRSKSKRRIKMDEIRGDLKIILDHVETTKTQKSTEAVQKDYGAVDDGISHFLDSVEAIKLNNDSTLARENVRKQGSGNVELLKQIGVVNKRAKSLKLKPETIGQLTLKPRSFTAPAASTAREVGGKNLLHKIANWPGPDLQLKVASLFERAKPEYGPGSFKQACKEVLLELAEQEFILSSLSDEFINTIEDERDKEKLRTLGQSVKKLLLAFRDPDSPLTRLGDLARTGYNYPETTARKLVEKRAEFFRSLTSSIPPADLVPPPLNVQPPPGNGAAAAAVQPAPGNGAAAAAAVQPPPGNGAAAAAAVQPPPGNGAAAAAAVQPAPDNGAAAAAAAAVQPAPGNGAAAAAAVQPAPGNGAAAAAAVQPAPGNGQPAVVNLQSPVAPGNSILRPLPATPPKGSLVSGKVQSLSNLAQPGASVAPSGLADIPAVSNDPPTPLPGQNLLPANVNAVDGAAVNLPPPDDMPAPPDAVFDVPAAYIPAPTSVAVVNPGDAGQPVSVLPAPSGAAVPPPGGWPSNVPPPDDLPPPPGNVGQTAQPANKPATPGKFVTKRVMEFSGSNSASLPPPVQAPLGDALPPANVNGGDGNVPPPDYMPAPPQNVPPSIANGPMVLANLPPPPGDDPPPPANGLMAPGNLPPPPDSLPPPLPGQLLPAHIEKLSEITDVGIMQAIAEMNHKPRVLYTPQKPPQTGMEVANKKDLDDRIGAFGAKMASKVAAAAKKIEKQFKEIGGGEAEKNRSKEFDKRLIDNAEHNARMVSAFSDFAASNKENRLLVSERQEKISMLHEQALEAALPSPQRAVDEFFTADGGELRGNPAGHFFQRMTDQFQLQMKGLSSKLPESSENLTYEKLEANKLTNKITGLGKSGEIIELKVRRDFPNFEDATFKFLYRRPELEFWMPKGFFPKEIVSFVTGGLVVRNSLAIDNLFHRIGNEQFFKNAAGDIVKLMERQFGLMRFLTLLLTDEEYIAIFPDSVRDLIREYSVSVQEVAVDMLDPKKQYFATYQLAQVGQLYPQKVMLELNKAVIPLPPTDEPPPAPSDPVPTPEGWIGGPPPDMPAPALPNVATTVN